MKIRIFNYDGKSAEVEISDETRGINVELISGDEIITAIGDGIILCRIDAADVFKCYRHVGYPDGCYDVRVGTPEWEEWMNRKDANYWIWERRDS